MSTKRLISRREFLKASGITAIGLTVAACSPIATATKAPATAAPATAAPATAASATAASATQAPQIAVTQQPVTLSIWDVEAATQGIRKDDVALEIARQTGITMNVIQGDAQKFKVLLASGDLPDIIPSNPATQGVDAPTLISSGQLLALDDLLASDGSNITKGFPKVLEYSRKFLSSGQNKVYFLPVNIYNLNTSHLDVNQNGVNVGFLPRWDLYAKLGYPVSNNMDDFLTILKNMQDLTPKAADGTKVYALSGWTDWGLWPWHIPWIYENGYHDLPNNILIDDVHGAAVNLFQADIFWSGLKYYNKAFNMGILDPDNWTMKYDDFVTKAKRGETLVAYASWQVGDMNSSFQTSGQLGMGFEKVITGNPYINGIFSADDPLGYGVDHSWAITKNSKNPEACMRLLNFTYSDAGARLINSGVKGKQWDVVNGTPQLTQDFLANVAKDSKYTTNSGMTDPKLSGDAPNQILGDGLPANLALTDDQKAKLAYQVDLDFCKHYGSNYQYPGQVIADMYRKGTVQSPTQFWLFPLLVQAPSDTTSQIMSQVSQYMQTAVATIIMAKTDSDFSAQVAKAKADISAKGYDTAAKEMTKLFNDAQAAASGFSLK